MKLRILAAAVAVVALVGGVALADSWTDIRAAVYYDHFDEVTRLLDGGVDVNIQNDEGWTPLMVAAEQGDVKMVQLLLSRGADPSIKNGRDRSAFDVTTSSDVKRLLTGAAAKTATPQPEVSQKEAWDQARWAIQYNNPDEVARLLDEGLDINAKGRDGWTLLMTAAWLDKPDFVKALLQRGASKTVRNDKGQTAADVAASPEVRRLLGAPAAPPKSTPPASSDASTTQHCKTMYGKSYMLCGASDYSCKTKASTDYQRCLKQGTWY